MPPLSTDSRSRTTITPASSPSLVTTGSVDCDVSPAVRSTSDSEVFSLTIVTFFVTTALTGISVSARRSLPICSVLPWRARRKSSIDSVSIARATTSAVIVAIIAGSAIGVAVRHLPEQEQRRQRRVRGAGAETRRAPPARTSRAARSDAESTSRDTRWNKPPAIVPMKKVGPKDAARRAASERHAAGEELRAGHRREHPDAELARHRALIIG